MGGSRVNFRKTKPVLCVCVNENEVCVNEPDQEINGFPFFAQLTVLIVILIVQSYFSTKTTNLSTHHK